MSLTGNPHAQAAQRYARDAQTYEVSDAEAAQLNATLALTEATLALAQEQRTANLIAWYCAPGQPENIPVDTAAELTGAIVDGMGLR